VTAVVVVGGGVAGTAAAWAARRAGATVTLVAGGSGASTLSSGAIDRIPWWLADDAATESEDAATLLEALGIERRRRRVWLASIAGIVRPAWTADGALLDLEALGQGTVLVPRLDRPGWNAAALSRGWSQTPWATSRRLEFRSVEATLTRFVDERHLPDSDVAARHDEPERCAWLGERLRTLVAEQQATHVRGVILPPWLGREWARAAELTEHVGVDCGEVLAGVPGVAGLRFEAARRRLLAKSVVDVVEGRVSRVGEASGEWRVHLATGEALRSRALVLAVGGLVGGGLAYTPSEGAGSAGAAAPPRPPLSLTFEAPVVIGANGAPFDAPSSPFGLPPEALAWPFDAAPLLERAGVLTDEAGRVRDCAAPLYAVGDLTADRPRTWLAALEAGLAAGKSAGGAALRASR
jgi:glycerol-3-phosphate dehydrogenase subunit B